MPKALKEIPLMEWSNELNKLRSEGKTGEAKVLAKWMNHEMKEMRGLLRDCRALTRKNNK